MNIIFFLNLPIAIAATRTIRFVRFVLATVVRNKTFQFKNYNFISNYLIDQSVVVVIEKITSRIIEQIVKWHSGVERTKVGQNKGSLQSFSLN